MPRSNGAIALVSALLTATVSALSPVVALYEVLLRFVNEGTTTR